MSVQKRMTFRTCQRGMSFVSVVLLGAFLVCVGIIVAQSVPMFTEYMSIHKAVQRAANEVSESGARDSFTKMATVGYIDSITGKDLKIVKAGEGKITVSYSYEREIPLVGPAFLVYRFEGSATSK